MSTTIWNALPPAADALVQGKRLNRPNDVVCRSDGSLFFADPELRVPPAEREVGLSGV
jgi:gluconolactonase